MRDRYNETFARIRKEKRSAFIPFTVIGDPDFKTSLDVLESFAKGGADIIELGLPFSDPVADGPVNQKAAERSLKSGMNTDLAFTYIREARKTIDLPIGLLCYFNTVLQYGVDKFYKTAGDAGVDSVLVADVPFEEADILYKASLGTNARTVFMISELSDVNRIKLIAGITTGFLYMVSRLGVTGVHAGLGGGVGALLKKTRLVTKLPICVGFGVSGPKQAIELKKAGADGVICGSAIVKIVEDNLLNKKLMQSRVEKFVRNMRKAVS